MAILSYQPLRGDTEHDRSQVIVRNRDMERVLGIYRFEVITGDDRHFVDYLPLAMIWWELEILVEAHNIDTWWINDCCGYPLMAAKA